MKNETIYDVVFRTYEVNYADKKTKEKIRKFIKRQLNKEYPNRDWNALSKYEKDTFIYITIKHKMLNDYTVETTRTKLERKIDSYVKNEFLQFDSNIKQHNTLIGQLNCQYYNEHDSDEIKLEKYNELCKVIKSFNNYVPLPEFNQWINHPLTPFDYIISHESNPKCDNSFIVSESQMDHIIIEAMLKKFCEMNHLALNRDKIKECLNYLQDVPPDEFDYYPDEKDMKLLDTDEQLEMKETYTSFLKYEYYKKMLSNYDFFEDRN